MHADFVIVQMVASVCAGQLTPEEAAAEAERRAKRYYERLSRPAARDGRAAGPAALRARA